MKKYIKSSKSNWCQDIDGNVVYDGDKLVDREGWEWVVDKIEDDGTVNLSLLEDDEPVERHWGEYSKSDIKKEFELL